ncbi:glycosyltransferase 87 family protein [Gordonia hirsuta]|uniref:glycosyltransferase 87 family protein n=1 Tax=Gordonia hirsuta TaxID=53427 RepID=UPI00034D02F1|nr:glycosyltransferase 87 family protein [Gordonia hirsuta]
MTALTVTAVAFLLVVPYELIVGRSIPPVDFYVYRYGAESAYAGNDLYLSNVFGPGIGADGLPFTYSPFAALVLWPATLFTAKTAYLLWNIVGLVALGYVLNKYVRGPWPLRLLWLVLALIAARVSIVLYHHLLFGQINLVLMALCIADVFREPRSRLGRWLPRGVLIGIAGAIKFTPMLFLIFFLVSRRWRDAAITLASFGAATLVAFAVFPRSSRTFFTNTLWHLSDKVELDGFFTTSGNNSLTGAFAAIAPWGRTVGTLLAVLVTLVCLWAATQVDRRLGLGPAALVVGLTASIASPVSWIHHWVYLLPALVYFVFYGDTLRRWFAVLAAAFLIFTQGPTTGDRFLDTGNSLLWLPGIIARESLLLLALSSIVLLAVSQPRTAVLPPWSADGRHSR